MASSEVQERQRVEPDIYKGDFELLSENDIPERPWMVNNLANWILHSLRDG